MIDWLCKLPSRLAIAAIRCYQRYVSPVLGPRCRFQPTCSHYAVAVIRRDGVLRGGLRALWRILRCHPWSKGGYDPP
jgi:putative membrane protein insertion efficiency factor